LSRLSYSLAANQLFPRRFSALHPRFKTPYLSILVFGGAAALLVLPNRIEQMAAVYSLAATFAFCTAHLSVMRLRYVVPAMYRPYRMPLNIPFGRSSIPLLSVLGALAIGAVFTQLLSQNISHSSLIFMGWLTLGVLAFVAYRRHRKAPIWEPLETAAPEARRAAATGSRAPQEVYLRLGRRERAHEKAQAVVAPPAPHGALRRQALSWRTRIAIVAVLGVASVAAVVVDLSN